MSWDYEAKDAKEGSLKAELSSDLERQGISEEDLSNATTELFDTILQVSPPEKEEVVLHYIGSSSHSGAGGGKSYKLGNIRLNLNKLFGGIASGSLVFAGATGTLPAWAFLAAAISLWASLRGVTSVDVSENEVGVLLTLWKLKDSSNVVHESEQDILTATNAFISKQGRNALGIADVRVAIKNLEKIRSIKPARGGGWFVVEWVRVSYEAT